MLAVSLGSRNQLLQSLTVMKLIKEPWIFFSAGHWAIVLIEMRSLILSFLFTCHRHGPNPDDFDDGYHTVGAASAARQLQASGPAGDMTYAQVDMSQKKDRRPVTDVYAEVDKSKKTKKKPNKVHLHRPFTLENLID